MEQVLLIFLPKLKRNIAIVAVSSLTSLFLFLLQAFQNSCSNDM